MTKIDNTGIVSKKIVTDNLYNTQGEKYLTSSDMGGASGNFQEIINNAVQHATEDANNAKVLAETAALNALESERNVTVRAEEIISQITSEAKEAKVLSETAAVNALESERNVTILSENLSEHISEILSADGEIRITSAHALGDFYFSITSHMPEGVLPLNGSEVSRVTYSDLYNYVLNIHNELVTSGKKFIVSEEEWQNISIENNGYVPYYSYGTLDGMFRLPRMSGYLKATGEVDEAGNYIAEGLPNITGSLSAYYYDTGSPSGAFTANVQTYNIMQIGSADKSNYGKFTFDASASNPIYGNSEHVTPETNTLFVGVWALTAFTQVGTANLNELKEILSQCETILGDSLPLLSSRYDNKGLETSAWKIGDGTWLDGRIYTEAYDKLIEKISEGNSQYLEMKESELLSPIEFPESYLVDTENVKFRLPLMVVNERTIIKQWQEGTEWYTIYSDGWIEQGGEVFHDAKENHVVNLLVPYNNTNYNVTKSVGVDAIYTETGGVGYTSISNYTTTSFTTRSSSTAGLDRFRWKACGYGEIPPREEWEIDFNYYFKVSHGVDEGKINIEEKLTEFEEAAYTRLDEVVEEVSKDYVVHVDKQVGELYFSFDNYCPDGVIPLDGRLVSRATYADLWQWVQEKGLVKDDALITTNDENTVSIFNEDGTIRYCQWYGSGDGSLTFRMPKINGYLGATGDNSSAGQYIAEGLPNITGNIGAIGHQGAIDGAFLAAYGLGYGGGTGGAFQADLDASRSSSIYGNSEHVTPETNTLFVGVWAITASKAAVFDMRDVEEALKSAESYLMNNVPLMSSRWDKDGLGNLGWVKADGSWVDGKTYTGAYNYCVEKLVSGHPDFIDGQIATITEENFDKFIVDRISKRFRLPISNGQRQLVAAYKEGTQWYNIYSDGWVEQGGEYYNNSDVKIIIDLLVPFKDTTYKVDKILGIDGSYGSSCGTDIHSTWNYTTSSFTTRTYGSAGLNRFRWFAAGYGEILSVSSPLRNLHLYFKLAHEFYAPAQAELQEKLDLIDNLVVKTDINLPTLSSRWDSDFSENIGWVKSEGQWLNGNIYRDAYDLMVSRIGINDKFIEATEGTELTDENADKFLIDTTAIKFRLPLINGERILVQKHYENDTYGNNSYEIYSDGYCEQRYAYFPAATSGTITLLHPFKDTKYIVTFAQSITGESTDAAGLAECTTIAGEASKTKTGFRLSIQSKTSVTYLNVCGYANIPSVSDYNCNNYLYFKLSDSVPSTVVNTEEIIANLEQECLEFKEECAEAVSQITSKKGYVDYSQPEFIVGSLYNSGGEVVISPKTGTQIVTVEYDCMVSITIGHYKNQESVLFAVGYLYVDNIYVGNVSCHSTSNINMVMYCGTSTLLPVKKGQTIKVQVSDNVGVLIQAFPWN